jgi:hypothetical protein
MSKRPKWWLELDDDEEVAQELGGAPPHQSNFVWTEWGGHMWTKREKPPSESMKLLDLLYRIDETKDPGLLLPYILPCFQHEVRPHIKDLFERHVFKSRSRRTPSYRLTEQQQKLLVAVSAVRYRGVTFAKAAQLYGIEPDTLRLALKDQHSSLRRGRRR